MRLIANLIATGEKMVLKSTRRKAHVGTEQWELEVAAEHIEKFGALASTEAEHELKAALRLLLSALKSVECRNYVWDYGDI